MLVKDDAALDVNYYSFLLLLLLLFPSKTVQLIDFIIKVEFISRDHFKKKVTCMLSSYGLFYKM